MCRSLLPANLDEETEDLRCDNEYNDANGSFNAFRSMPTTPTYRSASITALMLTMAEEDDANERLSLTRPRSASDTWHGSKFQSNDVFPDDIIDTNKLEVFRTASNMSGKVSGSGSGKGHRRLPSGKSRRGSESSYSIDSSTASFTPQHSRRSSYTHDECVTPIDYHAKELQLLDAIAEASSRRVSLSNELEIGINNPHVSEEDLNRKRNSLSRILHALAGRFEEVGYCQGLDRIIVHLMRASR